MRAGSRSMQLVYEPIASSSNSKKITKCDKFMEDAKLKGASGVSRVYGRVYFEKEHNKVIPMNISSLHSDF